MINMIIILADMVTVQTILIELNRSFYFHRST